ncbi:hypothetical protein G9A89_000998 [Geosiphon pyriformis]|nr:hypothetical protein G9A89_000998 [Geosiphon pyriformis]
MNYGSTENVRKPLITNIAEDNDSINIIAEEFPLTKTPAPIQMGRIRCHLLPKFTGNPTYYSYNPFEFPELKIDSSGIFMHREVHIFQHSSTISKVVMEVQTNSLNPTTASQKFIKDRKGYIFTAEEKQYPFFPHWSYVGRPNCGTVRINIYLPRNFENPVDTSTLFKLEGYNVYLLANELPYIHSDFSVVTKSGYILLNGFFLKNITFFGNIGHRTQETWSTNLINIVQNKTRNTMNISISSQVGFPRKDYPDEYHASDISLTFVRVQN